MLTVLILVAIYFWQRDQVQGVQVLVVYAVVFAIPVVWLIVVLIRYLLARRRLRTLGHGTAIRIGPPGIQVAGLAAPWSQVASVAATKPGVGKPLELRLTLVDGRGPQSTSSRSPYSPPRWTVRSGPSRPAGMAST